MIITQLTDLQFKITNLYDSNNETIRIQDCNSFVGKFYTDNIDNSAICLKLNDELTNIKIEENADYCLINSTDLNKMKDGVLFFNISYSVADESYSDGLFNNTIAGNTNYYINLNNSDEIDLSDYYTKEEIDQKLDQIIVGAEIDLSSYYKKSEVDNLLLAKADKSELTGKQDTLISGTNIKTINNQSILGGGNIEIQASTDLSDYYTKEECNSTFATTSQVENKVDKVEGKSLISDEEIARLATVTNYDDTAINEQIATLNSSKLDAEIYNSDKANFATKTELNSKQETLISGTNIKTINGNSILGSGDITITGGGDIDLSNYYNKGEVDTKLDAKLDTTAYTTDKETFATKSELADYLTISGASATYQPKGNYLTEIPSEYVTDSELNTALNDKVDVTAYTADKSTFALKSEIPTDYVSDSELANYALKSEIPDTSNFATNETVNGIETRLQSVETELNGAVETTNNILLMI